MVARTHLGRRRTPAIITAPSTPAPWPAVVVAHGMWESAESLAPTCRRLADRGYLAVAVDLRGHGSRTGRWQRLGPEGITARGARYFMNLVARLSLLSALDIADVCETLRRRTEVDGKRIALWGNSLGCHAVLAAVPLCRPACVVAAYGNAGWDLMWRLSWPVFHPGAPAPEPQWLPHVKRLIDQLDPIHRTAEFSPTSLLLQHGRDDHPMVDGMTSLHDRLVPHYANQHERLRFDLYDGGHRLPATAETRAVEWFARWLL